MRAALHRAAKTGNLDRARDLAAGSRRAHRAPPRSGAHASRWCVDELPEHAPRPRRLRAERHARQTPRGDGTRVGPSELYGYDAHANIAFLTDASGNVTDTYTYDAWGNLIARTGTTPNTRLFAGAEIDLDLGLVNLRARYYDPSTGRFLTIDPFDVTVTGSLVGRDHPPESSDGSYASAVGAVLNPISCPPSGCLFDPKMLHRYLYGNADPANRVDPSGMDAIGDAIVLEGVTAPLIVPTAVTVAGEGLVLGGALAIVGTKIKEELCEANKSDDEAMCFVSCVGYSNYDLKTCLDSAFQRYANCLAGRRPGYLALCL
jgi:RHS repeat-associated protein